MQTKHSFDKVTLLKIAKGALIAGSGAAGLYILGAMKALDFGSLLTPIIAAIIPILVNALKEWVQGQ